MNTVAETRKKFDEDPEGWRIPLMDFVDDFRFYRDAKSIEHPFELGDIEKDAKRIKARPNKRIYSKAFIPLH